MINRKVRELSEDDIRKIADTYQNWRQGKEYEDVQGFCKEASLEEIGGQDYILTPGRYVGIEEQEEEIRKKLGAIGYEVWKISSGWFKWYYWMA